MTSCCITKKKSCLASQSISSPTNRINQLVATYSTADSSIHCTHPSSISHQQSCYQRVPTDAQQLYHVVARKNSMQSMLSSKEKKPMHSVFCMCWMVSLQIQEESRKFSKSSTLTFFVMIWNREGV